MEYRYKEKQKILILNPGARLGGAELSLITIIKLTKEKFFYHVILPSKGELSAKLADLNIDYSIIPWPYLAEHLGERNKKLEVLKLFIAVIPFYLLARKYRKEIIGNAPDLIISNGIKCHMLTGMVNGLKASVIWYMREIFEDRRLSRSILKIFSRKVRCSIAVSNSVKEDFIKYISSRVPVEVIYNPIDLQKFNSPVSENNLFNREEGKFYFCVLGAVTRLKGIHIFLEAAKMLYKENPEARFIIAGSNFYLTEESDDYISYLKSITESEKDFKERVLFLGHVEDVPMLLKNIEVLVQPNTGPEGLGRSVLEAMACGKPVIAVDRWGPAEIIDDNKNGLLFEHLNVYALYEKMKLIIESEDLRNHLGQNARKWISENLDSSKLKENFSLLMERLAAEAE